MIIRDVDRRFNAKSKMQISKALKLGKTQPELDFVDIELSTDTPLFLDPLALHEGQGRFAEQCSRDIEAFFEAVLEAAGTENFDLGLRLLKGLSEPDEIQMGFSTGSPRGRGVGEKQARIIFKAILGSKAVKSGLIRDLNDALMFVPGIGLDKISDITTNIIRRHLIEYTQNQFSLLGLEIKSKMPTGLLWDSISADWTESYDYIPVIKKRKTLLVPKVFVKYAKDFTSLNQKYYDGFVASFIRQRELATMGRLVTFKEKKDGTKKPHVYKEDIERNTPRNKESVAEFSLKHPEVYAKFKEAFFKHNPISVSTIANAQGKNFDEEAYSKGVIAALQAVPTGARDANDYQYLIVGILHFLFYPQLSNPILEREVNGGRKRIDISFDNTADKGVFSRLRQDPFLLAREIMIECKNYTHDIKNPELDQMIGRFDLRRGRFGIIMCRDVADKKKLVDRCTDAFKSQQGAIVVLCDSDVIDAISRGHFGREYRIGEIIQSQLRNILS